MAGIYHKVKRGQTLWRICKSYGAEMDTVAGINRLADTSRIYEGQLIFIPGADESSDDLALEVDFKDKAGDFIWPVKGKVKSFFGMKDNGVKNKGISIQAKEGESIVAARSGKVAFCSQELKGYGKTIILDHLDGYSTVYTYNSQNLVNANQLVRQGQVIARVGSTGRVKKPALYFEIRKGYIPQNPFFYLP
ncbi:MAG: peptidoglycan DD-metalloendopeptidase family protein [Candidatus Omnitrophica bacterium]|nr:peptidoglycan DD-metalloendopeptidase family protein [Candidatus Omnitrophota bacterium]